MPFAITMPKLSPTMTSGTVAKWHVKEGDKVEVGDVLLEVATDKATVEHSAIDEGYVRKIIVAEGQEAEVNVPIALMSEKPDESIEGFEIAPPKKEMAAPVRETKMVVQQEKTGGRVKASPLAKKLARSQGIDLARLQGSGPGGRIMKRDLGSQAPVAIEGAKNIALSQMRRVIARRLQEAKATIPHFYLTQEIDADLLVDTRGKMEAGDLKITYNDFVIRACALALKEHPVVNSGFDPVGEAILQFEAIDISVAVTLPEGLITPIVKGADTLGLKEISTEVKRLVEKAKSGKLLPAEFQGGSFTVSNLGMFGVSEFSAIINPPQGAILAVGGIFDAPVVRKGMIEAGKRMRVTLSCDHRVIDGVAGALFLKRLRELLENPALLVA